MAQEQKSEEIILLIDANSLIHRCFHALPPLTAPDGRPTQALYGIANVLLKLWREGKPAYAAALFDRPEPTFRDLLYKEYKAHRPKAPNELISQIVEAHELFERFGIRTFEMPGFEADDLIGTLAERFKGTPGVVVMVLTGDLDTLQLIDDGAVYVRTFRKGISDTAIYDIEAVKERYGLLPSQLVDYKALVGDASDNVKGVPGIGPKTATELLYKYHTLENLYEHLGDDPKLLKKLGDFKKEALLAKKLVTIKRDVPLSLGAIDELSVKNGENEGALVRYFHSLGFESLVRRFGSKAVDASPSPPGGQSQNLKAKKTARDRVPDAVFLEGAAPFPVADLRSSKYKVGFGLKARLKRLWETGNDAAPPLFDLGVAFWLLDPDFKSSEDPPFAFKHFLKRSWSGSEEDLSRAFKFCDEKLKENDLSRVFGEIEAPLLRVLARMEMNGIGISVAKLEALEVAIQAKIDSITKEIYAQAGEEFNLNSSQQLGAVLFEKLKVAPPRTHTAGGKLSTRADVLEELRDAHAIVPLILKYREHFKIQSTYVRPIQDLVDAQGRLHTEYIQTGAATGRLSSHAPNLQNIPQESVWAKDLRRAFEAREGYSFISFDYSQLELRILASLSGDEKMITAFRNGVDIHRLTAAAVFHISEDRVGPRERRVAKTLNFGLAYGMGSSAFAKASGLSRGEAQQFIGGYFGAFPRVREWQEKTKQECRERGYVQTPTGRRRYLSAITGASPRYVAEAERAAINQPVQGLEADLLKIAMIRIDEALQRDKKLQHAVAMLLTIHDELLFEVRDDMMKRATALITPLMEEAYPLSVPLLVSVTSGKNWGELAPYHAHV